MDDQADRAAGSTNATDVKQTQTITPVQTSSLGIHNSTSAEGVAQAASSSQANEDETFSQKIARYQTELENEFRDFETDLNYQSQNDELQSMDWDDLEERYNAEMNLKIAAEHDIMNEFSGLFKQFTLWMQISNEKEAERALKRLRTRIAFVRNSEEQLDTRQEHYAKVLAAFQEAMVLLGNP